MVGERISTRVLRSMLVRFVRMFVWWFCWIKFWKNIFVGLNWLNEIENAVKFDFNNKYCEKERNACQNEQWNQCSILFQNSYQLMKCKQLILKIVCGCKTYLISEMDKKMFGWKITSWWHLAKILNLRSTKNLMPII